MLKIAVFEDEYYTRKAIIRYVDRLGTPYKVCAEADNGRNALEVLLEKSIDIALVDINMPIMNGLDMIQEAYKHDIMTQMILLTGYSDFEYTRRAIQLNAVDYLLKPVQEKELQCSLERAHKKITDNLKKHTQKNQPQVNQLLRQQLAGQLTRTHELSSDTEILMEHLGFPTYGVLYYVSIIHVYPLNKKKVPNMRDLQNSISSQIIERGFNVLSYQNSDDSICCVLFMHSDSSIKEVIQMMDDLGKKLSNQFAMQCKIGLSSCCQSLYEISEAYDQVRSMHQHHMFRGDKEYQLLSSRVDIVPHVILFNSHERQKFKQLLNNRDVEAIYEYLSNLFDRMDSEAIDTNAIYLCVGGIISIVDDYKILLQGNTGQENSSFPALFSLQHLDKLRGFVMQYVQEVINLAEEKASAYDGLVSKAKYFIENNFSRTNLCLDDIGRELCISAQYLCTIFKQRTGITIGDFIYETRMNYALYLIKSGEQQVSHIAIACGYNDAGYFSKCFKKKFGISPKNFISYGLWKKH